MLRFRTLQSRIILFFLGLFTLVLSLAFYSVYTVSTRNAHAGIYNDLAAGLKVLDLNLKSRSDRLFSAAQVLAGDFSLKKIFASGDRATLYSVIKNHTLRIQADVMLVVSLTGEVLADTAHPGAGPRKFPLQRLLKASYLAEAMPSTMAYLDGRLYYLAAVPLRAPLPVAWIVAGFKIDDALALALKSSASLDVTFMTKRGDLAAPVIAASSLDAESRQLFPAAFLSAKSEPDGTTTFALKEERYLGLAKVVGGQGQDRIQVFLQHSMAEALQPFYRLRKILFFLFIAGVVVTLILGVFISSVVTKPVRELVKGAAVIEQGDYSRPLPVYRQDEIGALTSAFNHMRMAIAEREDQIKHLAYHDALTDLPNRSFLQVALKEAILRARTENHPTAIVMMNVNRFISVIAALGHDTGNAILQKVGALLRATAPDSSVVARMGGDVFALLIRREDVAGALQVVKSITAQLETPFWVGDAPVRIEARFGIAVYPHHGDDADLLLRHAEIALHLAKASPQGYALYSSDRDSHSIRHLIMLAELRHAIDRDELIMYYQPKIHFASGRIFGVEALIRWQHSEYGFVPPDEFITLSEGTGLIKPVTSWALKTAISNCAQLNDRGINLNVAVNLSARVLPDQQLPDTVASLLKEFDVPPVQITLEITESAIMTDRERTLDVITRLAGLGVRLCVDDFGTGYSSLAYLKILPIDEIKIDKTFVLKMDANENDAMIVRSIIELGHNLRFKVTAEGVENQQVWDMLGARGCDLSQGFLHGRPMPLDQLIAWAEKSHWGVTGGHA